MIALASRAARSRNRAAIDRLASALSRASSSPGRVWQACLKQRTAANSEVPEDRHSDCLVAGIRRPGVCVAQSRQRQERGEVVFCEAASEILQLVQDDRGSGGVWRAVRIW